MSARDAITKAIQYRHEKSSDADVAAHAITMLEASGHVILSPDEVRGIREAAKAEAFEQAELACFHQQSKIHDRKRTDWDRGNDSAVNGCIHAIRSLKGDRDAQ